MVVGSTAKFPPIAVLDNHADIVEVNKAWKVFGDRNGLAEEYSSVGRNYVEISEQADTEYGDRVAAEFRQLRTDGQTEFSVVYPCQLPNGERWFRLSATAVSIGGDRYYLLVHRRVHRDSPSNAESAAERIDGPKKCADLAAHGRLVAYDLSPDESATEGICRAFDSIGIDPQTLDTTLQDWTDPEAIDALQSSTACFHTTFQAWNYPIGLTTKDVTIYSPESGTE